MGRRTPISRWTARPIERPVAGPDVKPCSDSPKMEDPMPRSVFDSLLHPSLRAGDYEAVRLARTTAAFVGCAWIIGPILLPIMIVIGDYPAAWSTGFGSLAALVPLVLLRFFGKRDLAAHFLLANSIFSLIPSAFSQGGIHGPALDWLLLVPLLAMLLIRGPSKILWLVITLAVIASFGSLSFFGIELPEVVHGSDAEIRVLSSALSAVLAMYFLARAFESNKSRMATELETARHAAEISRRDAQRVLDAVDQGLFTITCDGHVGPGISAAAVRWFGAPAPGATAWAWLHPIDPDAAAWLELGWEAHHDGFLPEELTLAQLPQRLQNAGRTHALRWLTTEREGELLAVATDITDVLEAERAERAQREVVAVLIRLIRDRQGIVEFLDEADEIVGQLASEIDADPKVDARRVHTLKGNAGLFGLATFAAYCHGVEQAMSEGSGALSPADRHSLVGQWHELRARIDPFLGRDGRGVVQVARVEVERLLDAVVQHQPYGTIESELRRWTFEPMRTRLERIAEQARGLAARLGKGAIAVHVEDNGVALPPMDWAPFWSVFTHGIRNAVDHGLELPRDRVRAGKPERGQIWLSTGFDHGELVISIRDDGRGIDWQAIAARAQACGLPAATTDELDRALLADGVTTTQTVTAISGRGVGMSAVQEATRRLQGRVVIRSVEGQGATFEFRFPASSAGKDAGGLLAAA
jgi:two-component system, chemotaxis family, sensor kinase CheA